MLIRKLWFVNLVECGMVWKVMTSEFVLDFDVNLVLFRYQSNALGGR